MQPNKPADNTQTSYFYKLPKVVRNYTSQFFQPTDFKNLSLVSKEFHRLSHGQWFWEKTVKRHFPDKKIKPEINLDWAWVFENLEKEKYGENNRYAAIMFLILEGDVDHLRKMNVTMHELWMLDYEILKQHLFSIPELISNQKMLNLLYEIALKWFQDHSDKHPIQGTLHENGTTLLTWAIWCKQPINKIRELILSGAEVNQVGSSDYGGIYAAAQVGYLECMHLLMEHEAEIDEDETRLAWTPLYIAAMNEHLDCMNFLLDHDADVNETDDSGVSIFSSAASRGKLQSLKLLLQRGAKIHENNNFILNEAARMAAQNGRTECLRFLIGLGANVNFADKKQKMMPLHHAAKSGKVECIELLIANKADVNATDYIGKTPLHLAAEFSQIEAMEALLKHGAKVNSDKVYVNSALVKVLEHDNVNMQALKLLVDHGAQINYASGPSPLSGAAMHDCEALEYLISKGAEVNPAGSINPLYVAAAHGRIDTLRALIKHGANVDTTERISGMSPLMKAASHGYDLCVLELLNAGASVNLTDKNNGTALYYAADAGKKACVNLLLDHGADPEIPCHTTANRLALAHLEKSWDQLLRKHPRMKDPENLHITPIQIAKFLEEKSIVTALEKAQDKKRKYLRFR